MFTTALIEVATAITVHEGWKPMQESRISGSEPSVSYRNHNPGNLRYSPFMVGERDGFAVFISDDVGFMALVWDIWSKCKGKTSSGLNGDSTLAAVISVYAPRTENDTDAYIDCILHRTGFARSTKLGDLVKQ